MMTVSETCPDMLRPVDELIDELNRLGRNDWTVRSLIERAKNRQIKATKVGGRWYWFESDLDAILGALPVRMPAR